MPDNWIDNLHAEIRKGGKGPPCPMCGIPRSQRSDYLRCSACGVNWLEGENISVHPASERLRKLVAGAGAASSTKQKKESSHA